ncbi:hypothetical protein RQP46_009878 [Phenoliferia psychrophenolica]
MSFAFPELPSYPSHFNDSRTHEAYEPRGQPPPFTTVAVRGPRRAPPSDGPRPTPWPPLTIGKTPIYAPLVTLAEVKDHLRLLAAFRQQRIAVSQAHNLDGPTDNLSPSERYKAFLHHATWRFECWIKHFTRVSVRDDDDIAAMPLDVALAWHTLILNPPYVSEKGNGFTQKFAVVCPGCQLNISHEALGTGRLAHDLALKHPRILMSTLFVLGPCLGLLIVSQPGTDAEELTAGLGEQMGWNLTDAGKLLEASMGGRGGRPLNKILSAYTTGSPFSIDLPAAILRQNEFLDQMHQLGWLSPTTLASSEALLHRANVRYHAFLDLAHLKDSGFVVPTLDIDLCWHTHMLSHDGYFSEMIETIGYFLDQ